MPHDEALLRAAQRARSLGCVPLSPAAGALLSVLAASLSARAVVEIGTCAGVAALWLFRGMPADGVVTTIDRGEHLRAARTAFAEAGIAAGRTRTIGGSPGQVMPRLADHAYDLVLIGGDPRAWQDYAIEALRILRPGGMLAVDGTSVGEVTGGDTSGTAAAHELARSVRDDSGLLPALVPIGDGLLLAVKTHS